jgi:hypothetical protein
MFTGQVAPWHLENFRVFGSPVYVLDKRLQDGDSLAKWKARSWLGVYIGHSLVHAGNVPVVYNPTTTHISPQYHVVFDDQFTSVGKSAISIPDDFFSKLFTSASWEYQFEHVPVSGDLYTFDTYWQPPPQLPQKRSRSGKDSFSTRASAPVCPSEKPSTPLPVELHSNMRSASPLTCECEYGYEYGFTLC